MNATIEKTTPKRPSRGQRKHNRLMKQEERKASIPWNGTNKSQRRPA